MTTRIATTAAAALALLLAAPAAMAKGHDQGGTETPGENVQAETVTPAQGLGAILGAAGKANAPGQNRQ